MFMMTPDKDFAQLVTDNIRMFRPERQNPASVWGPEEVKERYGLQHLNRSSTCSASWATPQTTFRNPWGVKTAIKFLQAYGSMEGL